MPKQGLSISSRNRSEFLKKTSKIFGHASSPKKEAARLRSAEEKEELPDAIKI